MNYILQEFPNIGFVSASFTDEDLAPIKKEIQTIKNNFENFCESLFEAFSTFCCFMRAVLFAGAAAPLLERTASNLELLLPAMWSAACSG